MLTFARSLRPKGRIAIIRGRWPPVHLHDDFSASQPRPSAAAVSCRGMSMMHVHHTEGEFTKVVPSIEDAIADIHDGATM